ncbi:hypothetical protein J4E91_009430 [Alternaria rosae]|nr:hypothetical protein J4E91_009430 [Alternaria rosae]
MASRETPLQRNVSPVADFLRGNSDRDIEVRYDRFVNDNGYEQRIANLPSSSGSQQKGSSHMEAEKHRSAPARLEKTHEGFSIDKTTDTSMDATIDSIENHDSVLGPHNNPVRVSRKAAVKRNSTKEKKKEAERHDGTVQSTHVRAKTSSNAPVIRITASTPPVLRRFSFDKTPNELSFNLAKLSNSPDFEDVPLTPVAGRELGHSATSVLDTHHHIRESTSEEREKPLKLWDMKKEQRRVPTTFNQILGEKKTPTALL